MAVQRPNVIVFQEYKTLTVTPDIPDLDALIVGECYQILDYLDDKDLCEAATYGTLNSPCPLVDPTAVIISDPPNVVAGGELIADSVAVYFDAARAVITESYNPAANSEAIYTAGDNLFEAHNLVGGVHFGALHVEPGDTLITESMTTDDYVMTVKELCYTLYDKGATIPGFITSGVQPDDIVTLANDVGSPSRNGTYIVKRVVSEDSLEVVSATWTGNIAGAVVDISITDPTGTPRFAAVVGATVSDFCNLRTTSDFEGTGTTGNALRWRAERVIVDHLMESSDFSVTDNQITVLAARLVDLDYTTYTLTGRKISYAKIYTQYKALRTDLQQVTALSNTTEILEALGKFDARNPLCVGAITAKANTTTGINVYGTSGPDSVDYLDFIDRISTVRDVYAIAPLTYNASILGSLLNMAKTLADPNEALSHGFKQKFRVIVGAVDLPTTKYMVNARGGATASVKTGTAPASLKQFTLSTAGTGTLPDHFAIGTLPGDTLRITDTVGGITYTLTVAQVNDSLVLESDEVSPWGAPALVLAAAGVDKIEYFHPDDLVTPYADETVTAVTFPDITITPSALDNLYLILDCPGANFLTQGCIPGDYLQFPYNPTVNSWTSGTVRTFVIDEVLSNQRVRVTNEGTNTSTVENELPHGGNRVTGVEITAGALFCRVQRELTKDQQVSEMISVAQSLSDKRLLLAYPNLVDVADLVDGSKPPTTDSSGNTVYPDVADPQPGYYLACAVAGQTAGNPPQQGFTNMGIAGITRIYNSSEYFTEQQLTDLSNGGVYVFMQETPSALPYSIHEVTTDVSVLQFAEYMVVKDFDFVAWTFLDTLLPFLGEWNVTPQTIEFIRQALYTTADVLKSRYVAKIGAPLVDYTLDTVEISDLSPDRIEAYMQVSLPMTLNTIGLHLVA